MNNYIYNNETEFILLWNTMKTSKERATLLNYVKENDREMYEVTLMNFYKALVKRFNLEANVARRLYNVINKMRKVANAISIYYLLDVLYNMGNRNIKNSYYLLTSFLRILSDTNFRTTGDPGNYHKIYEMPSGKYNEDATVVISMYELLTEIAPYNEHVITNQVRTMLGCLQKIYDVHMYAISKTNIDNYGIDYFVDKFNRDMVKGNIFIQKSNLKHKKVLQDYSIEG